jgi:hypothetical protein
LNTRTKSIKDLGFDFIYIELLKIQNRYHYLNHGQSKKT